MLCRALKSLRTGLRVLVLVAVWWAGAVLAASPMSENVSVLTMGSWRTDDIVQMNLLLDRFYEQHPHIRILFDPTSPPEYDRVLKAQLRGGTAPDIFYLRSFSTSRKLFDAGHLQPLDDLPGLFIQFSPRYLQPWQSSEGTVYGVPFIATSHGVYYNQELFHRLNLSVPETWEELLAAARIIRNAGVTPFANAAGDPWTINELVMMNILPGFTGGREGRLAYLSGERCFNDQDMEDAFQALADLAPFLPENHSLLRYVDSLNLFLQGRAAMWMGGSWDIASIEQRQPTFAWDVFAPPPPAGRLPVVVLHPDAGMGLNTASGQKEAARVFLSWLTSPATGKLLAESMPGFFPMHANRPVLENVHAQSFLRIAQESGEDIRFVWDGLRDGEPDGYVLLQDLAVDVLLHRISARQAANALQDGLARWFATARDCGK